MRRSWPLLYPIHTRGQLSIFVLSLHLLNFLINIVESLSAIVLIYPISWHNSGETQELTHLNPVTLHPLSLPSTSWYLSFKKKYLSQYISLTPTIQEELPMSIFPWHPPFCHHILRLIINFINYYKKFQTSDRVVAALPRRASN